MEQRIYRTTLVNNKKRSCNIFVFLVIILGICLISPYLSTHVPRIFQVGIVVLWFLLASLNTLLAGIRHDDVGLVTGTVMWMFIIAFYRLLGYSSASWGNYFNQIVFFGAILMLLFVNRYFRERQKCTLFWAVALITLINIIDNIRLNVLYPGASVMAVSLNWYPWLADTNVGVTSFSTMALLFFNVCFLITLYAEAKSKRILFAVFSIISAYYIIACGMRASVVLFLVFSFFIGIYIKMCKRQRISDTTGILILVLLMLLISVFSVPLLRFLISISSSDRLTERFGELLALMTGGSADEHSFANRVSLYLLSLKTFVQSPVSVIFGIGDHRQGGGVGLSGFYSSGIGGHSDFIDSLARYGILGGFFLTYIFSTAYKAIMRPFKGMPYEMHAKMVFFFFMLCGLTKAVFCPEIGFMVFLLLPYIPFIVTDHHIQSV